MTNIEMIKDRIMGILNQMNLPIVKLILFGSRATGNFKENSDWDFLIVLGINVTREEKKEIGHKIRKELAEIYIPCDVIIKSQDELEKYKDVVGSVIRSAVKRGIVL